MWHLKKNILNAVVPVIALERFHVVTHNYTSWYQGEKWKTMFPSNLVLANRFAFDTQHSFQMEGGP